MLAVDNDGLDGLKKGCWPFTSLTLSRPFAFFGWEIKVINCCAFISGFVEKDEKAEKAEKIEIYENDT